MTQKNIPGAQPALKQTLGTLQLWGIAVGLVISHLPGDGGLL